MSPTIKKFPEDSLEWKAYNVVDDIPTIDVNDKYRLGYHVYLFLINRYPSLREAIHIAQARMSIPPSEAYERIAVRLREYGFEVGE